MTKTTVDVSVDFDMEGYEPSDDDFADFDLASGASIGDVLMGKGDISYNPGDDMNLSNILKDALNGAGNDVGMVNAQSNTLTDNDELHSATVSNDSTFKVDAVIKDNSASSDEGIEATGGTGGDGSDDPSADGGAALAGGGISLASGASSFSAAGASGEGDDGGDGGGGFGIGLGSGVGAAGAGANDGGAVAGANGSGTDDGGHGGHHFSKPWNNDDDGGSGGHAEAYDGGAVAGAMGMGAGMGSGMGMGGAGGDGGDGYGASGSVASASGGYSEAYGGQAIGGDGGMVMGGSGGNAGGLGSWGSGNGDDGIVTGQSYADASGVVDTTAFNQSIVMGANVLGNTVDTTVVGGSLSSTYIGDDDAS
ncbi:hypothetical protein FGG78_17270 [Thioclava sp. BHET1]|nr:hypothetical protein FGG78_17270 [Thioclava sp. BHET1]